MSKHLPFEEPLVELRRKISELQNFGVEKNLDFSNEINILENRYAELKNSIYQNLSASNKMSIARHISRPTTLDYINLIFTDFVELHGDRLSGDDPAIIGGIAKLNDIPVTVIGHQKGKDTRENIYRKFGMPDPEGFRKALRLMKQANKFNRPVITFIDTPGANPGAKAEEHGQAEAIARNLSEMSTMRIPIICVVIGEGGSGGALAISVGNRILMLENSIYSVASPNAAAAILWKDSALADRAADAMKITANDLEEFGIIDGIIPEPKGGSHLNLELQANYIKESIIENLQQLRSKTGENLIEERYNKFRKIGALGYERQ